MGTLIPTMILSTTYDKYLLLFTTKSKQIPELFQIRGFNGYTGVIGYADSEYDTVKFNIFLINKLLLFTTLNKQISEFSQKRGFNGSIANKRSALVIVITASAFAAILLLQYLFAMRHPSKRLTCFT